MIGEKQKQDVAEGGTAIQSGRDTHLHTGVSPDDVRAIVGSLADQLPKFAAIARDVVEERLKEFEEKVFRKFDVDGRVDREAFKQPDFQFVVGQAQQAYARTGNEQTVDALINLIAERSKLSVQARLARNLNGAVEKASFLAAEDFAILSLSFLLRRVVIKNVQAIDQLISLWSIYVPSLLPRIPTGRNAYTYLESLSCGKELQFPQSLPDIIYYKAPHIFSDGVELNQLKSVGISEEIDRLVAAGLLAPKASSSTYKFPFSDVESLKSAVSTAGLTLSNSDALWNQSMGSRWEDTNILDFMRRRVPYLDELQEKWSGSSLQNFDVTSIGACVAHANLNLIASFDADLGIWAG